MALTLVCGVVSSCQVVKSGARCKTNQLNEDGGPWVMKCEKGRWRRAITKADAARLLAAYFPTTTTTVPPTPTQAPATAAPATTAAPDVTVPLTPQAVAIPTDLDPSFGDKGHASANLIVGGRTLLNLLDVRPTAAGLYVFYSTYGTAGSNGVVVGRFDVSGRLDTGFSGDGLLEVLGANSATADNTGRVYFGTDFLPDTTTRAISRFTTSGAPDTAVGVGGKLTLSVGSACGATRLTALSDDSVALSLAPSCNIWRLLPNGTAPVFGNLGGLPSGSVAQPVAGPAGSFYVRLNSTYSFEGSGMSFPGSGTSFPGSGTSFPGSGTSFPGSGTSFSGASYSFVSTSTVVKLTSSGARDATFGTAGVITLPSAISSFDAMTVLSDGSMVFAPMNGMSFVAGSVFRHLFTNGTLDVSGGFVNGQLVAPSTVISPLGSGGFLLTAVKNTGSTISSYSPNGTISSAVSGISGTGRLQFDLGRDPSIFSRTFTVAFAGSVVAVVGGGGGRIDLFRFKQSA